MNSDFFRLFSPEISQGLTIYVFLIIIVICFVKFFVVKKETESRGVQKIIGGLAVFVVALLSHNLWIQALSLFIGGLIIASEDFMQKLAIIVKSESPDIGKNLEVTKPTQEEIKEKRNAEVTELKKTIEKTSKKKVQRSTLLHTVILAESLVADYFREKVGDRYQEDVKVLGMNMVSDGVILNENTVTHLVEIIHLPSFGNMTEIVFGKLTELRIDAIHIPLIFCIVLDYHPLQSEIKKFLSEMQSVTDVEFGIFQMKSDRLVPIVEPKL
jgi:hypothetical protein